MRESAAATPPDPYLGGWIRSLLMAGSYLLDFGSILYRTIRPLLPSPPEPPPQPKPSPAPKQKESHGTPPPPYNKFNRYPWDDGSGYDPNHWNYWDWGDMPFDPPPYYEAPTDELDVIIPPGPV